MHNHLHIGNVRQSVQGNILERPDPGQHQHQSPGENKKSIIRAPINYAGDHGCIPPSAFKLTCFVATTAPPLVAVMLICQVPPVSNFTCPSYMLLLFSLRGVTTFTAAMPICGIAGMKLLTLICAPVIGEPAAVSRTRYKFMPLRGVDGSVEKSTFAPTCAPSAFMAADAPAPGGGGTNEPMAA